MEPGTSRAEKPGPGSPAAQARGQARTWLCQHSAGGASWTLCLPCVSGVPCAALRVPARASVCRRRAVTWNSLPFMAWRVFFVRKKQLVRGLAQNSPRW